jgi:hypothetical protein
MQIADRLRGPPLIPGRLRWVLGRQLRAAGFFLLSVTSAATTECEPGMFGDSFDFPW